MRMRFTPATDREIEDELLHLCYIKWILPLNPKWSLDWALNPYSQYRDGWYYFYGPDGYAIEEFRIENGRMAESHSVNDPTIRNPNNRS